MNVFQQPSKMENFELELISCSRQPGNLQISKHACARCYLKAQLMAAKRSRTFGHGFSSIRSWSLEICKTCPEGRHCAKENSLL